MYSDEFKINVNNLNSEDMVLVLLEITHPYLSESIKLVNDNQDIVSNGSRYLAMNFGIKRQDDIQGELPKVTLRIPNVGRSLIRWIDSSGGAKDANINFKMIRRSDPDTIEESLNLGVDRIIVTTELIDFSLIIQNNLIKRAVKLIYDTKNAPGLF